MTPQFPIMKEREREFNFVLILLIGAFPPFSHLNLSKCNEAWVDNLLAIQYYKYTPLAGRRGLQSDIRPPRPRIPLIER